jgi:predicted MFS family arabinose efflux permease
MLTPYRHVLAVPGALAFALTGLVARLPISMLSLGIVVLVSTRTGSYRLAGSVAAAYLVGNAAFAVIQGRMADRLGQSTVLPWTVLVFTGSLGLMMWSVEAGWPSPLPQALAAIGGASFPQIGSCIRARWSHNVPDKVKLQTAFALEAVLDDVVFVVGPILVTVLATTIDPAAGLGTAIVAGLVGSLALAAQRSTEPPAHRNVPHKGAAVPMGWSVLAPLVVTAAALGVVFGGVEVSAVAFAEELGSKAASGPLLAVLALGSGLAGFATGTVEWRWSVQTRFRVGMLALAVALLPLPFIDGLALMGVGLFLVGFAVAPTLIAIMAWIEQTVPARRLTEGISMITTGLYVGLAPGAAAAGEIIDRYGASPSFWVPAAAAGAGAVLAWATALGPATRPRADVGVISRNETSRLYDSQGSGLVTSWRECSPRR